MIHKYINDLEGILCLHYERSDHLDIYMPGIIYKLFDTSIFVRLGVVI